MTKINNYKLSLLLIMIMLFASTCTTSTTQPFQRATLDSTNVALAQGTSEGTTEYKLGVSINATPTTYLPAVLNPAVKFIGIYLDHYWENKNIAYLTQIDQGAGKKHTSVGWFIDLQNIAFTPLQNDNKTNNFFRQLETLWNNGYISFVNVGSALQTSDYDVTNNCPIPISSSQITSGACDPAIQKLADLYYQWVSLGGGRRAMIAPLQEMNGVWTSYGMDPNTADQFKEAYRHILDIFAQKGITRDQVWWVFAPNGYNDPGNDARKFENYYPGDDVVDIVGFSSYNYGYCPDTAPYWRWESYPDIFEPFITRMQAMAPSKPIIIAETASTAYNSDGDGNPIIDYNQMNQWLIENYNYFANRDGVIGVFYFSLPTFNGYSCAIEINPNGEVLSGYATGVSPSVYQYLNTTQLDKLIKQSR